jgi:hypothetical protein
LYGRQEERDHSNFVLLCQYTFGGVEKPVPAKTRRLLQKLIFAAAHLKSCPECTERLEELKTG